MLASPFYPLLIPVLVILFAFYYVQRIIARLPEGRATKIHDKISAQKGKVIACIGDSLTHGNIGVCWVEHLRKEFPNELFLNEGINGDVAWQVLQRLSPILNCKPDIVIVMIGSNDAMGSFNASSAERYQKSGHLPHLPSLNLYKEHLHSLLDQLDTIPQVAVCTLPPVGEFPDSAINRHIGQFNQSIKEAAESKSRTLLDVSADMWNGLNLRTYPVVQDYETGIWVLAKRILNACVRHYLFRTPWDAIAESQGQWLLFDQIHLGERGAKIIQKRVQAYLKDSGLKRVNPHSIEIS